MPLNYFFDDMLQDTMESLPRWVSWSGETLAGHGDQLRDQMAWCETLKMVRTYDTIERPIVRKRISEMVKSIATTPSDE